MDNKQCVHFAIISHPITLDKFLETYDVSDGFFAVPYHVFVAWYLAFLGDLQTPAIACHLKSILGLDYFWFEVLVTTQIKGQTDCLVVAHSVDPTLGSSCASMLGKFLDGVP